MRHSRLDSLLLAGVGTLAVHELAYLPGSFRTSMGAAGVSHDHMPLLWGIGGTVAIAALLWRVVRSMRSRRGERSVDPAWLALAIGAFYTSQEAAERALSGSPAITLLTEWVLWLGLAAIPAVAVVLARLVQTVVESVSEAARRVACSAAVSAPRTVVIARPMPHRTAWLAHSLARRGPPLPSLG